MFNLKKNTKIVVLVFIVLYVCAWLISAIDIHGTLSNLFCAIITVMVSIGCFTITIRAYFLARKIERSENWHSICCCKGSSIQVITGYAILMFVLGVLKAQAVSDLFITHWFTLPAVYHLQAWSFLAHNAMDILLAWVVLNIFEEKYKCAQISKVFVKSKIVMEKKP